MSKHRAKGGGPDPLGVIVALIVVILLIMLLLSGTGSFK